MRSSNPVLTGRGFARIKGDAVGTRDLNTIEARPSSAPMSIDDVVIKTAGLFAVLLAVVPARKIEVVKLQIDAKFACCRVHHAQAFGHDFLANAIARNDGDAVFLAHGVLLEKNGSV